MTQRATQSFHACGRFVAAGDELDDNDPIIKGREVLFEAGEPPAKPKRTAKKAAPK